jgi:hypothetical protein
MANNPKAKDNLIPFKKGVPSPHRNTKGRPRKFILELKEQGYKLSEVTDSIAVLISLTEEELKDIYDNENSTVLEKVVSSAILKSIRRGDMTSIESLLNRAYGKSRQQVDVEANVNITNHSIKLKFGNMDDDKIENDGEETETTT